MVSGRPLRKLAPALSVVLGACASGAGGPASPGGAAGDASLGSPAPAAGGSEAGSASTPGPGIDAGSGSGGGMAAPGSRAPAPTPTPSTGMAEAGPAPGKPEAGSPLPPGDAGGRVGQAGQDASPPAPTPSFGHCTAPTGAKWSDAQNAYNAWYGKTTLSGWTGLVTSSGAGGFLRILRPNSPNAIDTSNSEGVGYGMLIAAAMNDQTLFDDLWKYEQLFLDGNGLMNWEINPQGTGPTSEGTGAATDGDEDMAFALLWADHLWGGKGSLSDTYRNLAVKQIGLIWQYEVDHTRSDAIAPGDSFGGAAIVNISYFAPAYYRLFATVSGNTGWNTAVDTAYTIVAATLNAANGNATNGLVPAWSTPAGVPQAPNSSLPTNHQLDSCRTPFRLGQDFCFNGEPRAAAYLAKISAFYQQVGAKNIANGYTLTGTPQPTNPTVNQSAAFVGPAGVGAMSDPMFAVLRDQAYAGVASLTELDGSLYYTESWTVLSLVMMNGGFWNPTN